MTVQQNNNCMGLSQQCFRSVKPSKKLKENHMFVFICDPMTFYVIYI